ncbi:MAG: oxygen-dependent coproporphyrinogen oxidase [Candidatus Sericytochromatia bacterium]
MFKRNVEEFFRNLQSDICKKLEKADGLGKFSTDTWKREEGGGGISCVIKDGNIIEKGGVMFSAVEGKLPEKIQKGLNLPETDFFATGVSIIMHPKNPHVPIIHMNTRYFETSAGINWFGGGIDLTPHYVEEDDAKYFHTKIKETCDKHDKNYYAEFKKWADNYFYIKHRNETRGIGGIFFDRLSENNDFTIEDRFNFVQDIGKLFVPIYTHFMENNYKKTFSEKEKNWQLLRRGRYVEFNLIYDAGTKFGLETNGRIESILVSMPPFSSWEYNFLPEKNSKEEKTLNLLKKDINWA